LLSGAGRLGTRNRGNRAAVFVPIFVGVVESVGLIPLLK
jgi:hypothetical protein